VLDYQPLFMGLPNNSSSNAYAALPDVGEADERAAVVPHAPLAPRRLAEVGAIRKPLAADRLAEVGARISHTEGDNSTRVIRRSQRPENQTRSRRQPRRDGPSHPTHRGPIPRGPSHQPRQESSPWRQRERGHNLLFALFLVHRSQCPNGVRRYLFRRYRQNVRLARMIGPRYYYNVIAPSIFTWLIGTHYTAYDLLSFATNYLFSFLV
jgi:hypothetical protein